MWKPPERDYIPKAAIVSIDTAGRAVKMRHDIPPKRDETCGVALVDIPSGAILTLQPDGSYLYGGQLAVVPMRPPFFRVDDAEE